MKTLRTTLTFLLLLFTSYSYAADTLVSASWLSKQLGKPNLVLIDMSDETQYQRFHIKTAIQLPYHILNKQLKNRVSLSIGQENIVKLLGLLGITPNSHVVIYDDIGGLHASRLFWELERIQHKNVSILNGGLVKWILDGYPVTATPFNPKAKTFYPLPKSLNDSALATLKDVLPDSRDKKALLIDVRTKDEYTGSIKKRRSGHIPGAKLWSWDNSIDFENQFKFKPSNVLQQELAKLGLRKKNQPVVLYCRSGHRASQSYLTLRSLGYDNVKIYDASMKQYSITPNAPLTKGFKP